MQVMLHFFGQYIFHGTALCPRHCRSNRDQSIQKLSSAPVVFILCWSHIFPLVANIYWVLPYAGLCRHHIKYIIAWYPQNNSMQGVLLLLPLLSSSRSLSSLSAGTESSRSLETSHSEPWPGDSVGWNVIPSTQLLQVWFPVRAHK